MDEFTCNDGQCTSLAARCNGFFDCNDRSDEYNCVTPPPTRTLLIWKYICLALFWVFYLIAIFGTRSSYLSLFGPSCLSSLTLLEAHKYIKENSSDQHITSFIHHVNIYRVSWKKYFLFQYFDQQC